MERSLSETMNTPVDDSDEMESYDEHEHSEEKKEKVLGGLRGLFKQSESSNQQENKRRTKSIKDVFLLTKNTLKK